LDLASPPDLPHLLVEAANECVERLATLPSGACAIPEEQVDVHVIVPVQDPSKRHEGRENAVGTNGVLSILREVKRVRNPLPVLTVNWHVLKDGPQVSRLISLLESIETESHRRLFESAKVTPVPVAEQYSRVILSTTIQLMDSPSELRTWTALAAERLWRSITVSGEYLQYVAPLIGFDARPTKPIEISDRLRLRPISDEDRRELENPKTILGRLQRNLPGFLAFARTGWVAEYDVTEPTPGHATSSAEAFNQIASVVRALRIFKDGRFDFTGVGCRYLPYGSISSGTPNPWFLASLTWTPFESAYLLEPGEIPQAARLVRAVMNRSKGRKSTWIDIAATRLSDAFRRDIDRDQLVDSVVLLEVVLLHDCEDELGFRLATRGALLLGSNPAERVRLRQLLKDAYDRRSKILHGKGDPGEPKGSEVRQVARAVLMSAILRTESMDLDRLLRTLDAFGVGRVDGEDLDGFVARDAEGKTGRL